MLIWTISHQKSPCATTAQAATLSALHFSGATRPSRSSLFPWNLPMRSLLGTLIMVTACCLAIMSLEPKTSNMVASGTIVKPQGLNREVEKQIVDRILGEGYDKRIRPSGINNKTGQNDGPAVVRVNTFIRSISKIDDVTMEYSVQLSLRQEWVDERLAFSKLVAYKNYNINSITLTEQERLWKPDLFFRNEKEGHFHKIIMPNVLLRITGDGAVLYSIRISLVLACPMDLKYYPLDKQNCTIEMASYGYLDDDLKFIWKEKNPVQINQPLTLPRFTLETFGTAFCTSRTATGAYSCLRVDLIFKREFSYYLIQIYIPCCMLVIVSWVSFWLDPNAIPARVSLGVTTLLTMATQISGINASLPPVSYTKAIDVWTGVCLTFVFGALLEFALVNYASRSDAHARMQQARQEEELRARELEFQQRQQLAAAAAAQQQQQQQQHQRDVTLAQQHQQQQQQHHHQQQKYATYGPNYAQKFPLSRSDYDSGLPNGGLNTKVAPVAANGGQQQQQQQQQTNTNETPIAQQQQQFTGEQVNNGTQDSVDQQQQQQQQLLANRSLALDGFQERERDKWAKWNEVPHCMLWGYHYERKNPLDGSDLSKKSTIRRECERADRQYKEVHQGLWGFGTGQYFAPEQRLFKIKQAKASSYQQQASGNNKQARANTVGGDVHEEQANVNFCRAWLNKFPSRSKRIDVISRIFFPKMFALFNLVYWTTYLFREDDIVQA